MKLWPDLIWLYLAASAAVWLFAAFVYATEPRTSTRQTAARVFLTALLWPAWLVYALVVGFQMVWEESGWGRRRR